MVTGPRRPPLVAIDGPGGAGKSTVASLLARRLGVERLDTGAMYRAVALAALRAGLDPTDAVAVGALAPGVDIDVDGDRVRLGGEDVSDAVRTPPVSRAASAVAAHPAVRADLVARQRAWVAAHRGSGVVEGRDIAAVVCPEADLKVYLTARDQERARRRTAQLLAEHTSGAGAAAVAAELARRDRDDATRAASPLQVAPGAVVVDTTDRDVEEVVSDIVARLAPSAGPAPQPEPAGPAPQPEPAGPAPQPVPGSPRLPRRSQPAPGGTRLVAPTRAARWFYAVARAVVIAVSKSLWRVTIEGTERVPATGAFIVSPVHRSNIDTILMGFVSRRRLCYLAKDSLWSSRPLGWLVAALGGFPVRRGGPDREALSRCVEVLRSDQSLVVFPEGTRQSGPKVAPLFEGAAYLALRTGAPIVPVGIGGSEGALPKGSKRPRRVKVHMVVGSPIRPEASGGTRVHRSDVAALTGRLQAELQSLFDRAQAGAGS